MTTEESFEFALELLEQDTEMLERVLQFIELVANGDGRAYEIIARISNGQINSEAAPDVLNGYLARNTE